MKLNFKIIEDSDKKQFEEKVSRFRANNWFVKTCGIKDNLDHEYMYYAMMERKTYEGKKRK